MLLSQDVSLRSLSFVLCRAFENAFVVCIKEKSANFLF